MKSRTENPPNPVAANEDPGYAALQTGIALVEHDKAVLRLTGKDPVGMLNAILTNQIPDEDNLGAYALLLNPKGRIQADLRILKNPSGEGVIVIVEPEGAGAAKEILSRYAPFSRVKLDDVSGTWGILGLYGPRAAELLGGMNLREHETAAVDVGGTSLIAAGVAVPTWGFDLLGQAEALRTVRERLVAEGAVPADRDAYETARVEAGVPRFGADMTPDNFPGEAGVLDRAVSFEKGCYPGQETVARMRYRGHPNRTLHKLLIEGSTPSPGEDLVQNDKSVGKITSVVPYQANGYSLALGYLHRKADPKLPLRAGETECRVVQEGS